jgi:hypothetical protein
MPCKFGSKCKFLHIKDVTVAEEYKAKDGKVLSICKFGKKCRKIGECANLHLEGASSHSAPRRERKSVPSAVRNAKESHRLLLKFYQALANLEASAAAFKGSSLEQTASQARARLHAAEAASAALLEATKACFDITLPLPDPEGSTDDSPLSDETP